VLRVIERVDRLRSQPSEVRSSSNLDPEKALDEPRLTVSPVKSPGPGLRSDRDRKTSMNQKELFMFLGNSDLSGSKFVLKSLQPCRKTEPIVLSNQESTRPYRNEFRTFKVIGTNQESDQVADRR
jgi:hypothetical protein